VRTCLNRSAWAVLLGIGMMAQSNAGAASARVERYDVHWDTPSPDASGSMPLGNGDIGVNLWVESGGDLLFYIGKTDAWSENARLLKVGRIRVTLSPNPFVKGAPFSQRLKLHDGLVEITAGEEAARMTLKVWVDANHPVVRIWSESAQPCDIAVAIEVWRDAERTLEGDELFSAYGLISSPDPVVVTADTIMPGFSNRVVWRHRNERSIWPLTLRLQGMEEWIAQGTDPLLHRTFGGVIEGDGLVSENAMTLTSPHSSREHTVSVYIHSAQTPTPGEWLERIEREIARLKPLDWQTAFDAHRAWWHAFWDRSWVHVTGADDAAVVSRGYALQRFIGACGGRGAYPIKFNGSIFTVDAHLKDQAFDADYRSWGGPYWFQNTRLVYWPMLASGDFDLMTPLFRMFLDALPFARARTQAYFGHEGAFYPETMYFWGAYANDNYGWDREGKRVSHVDNTYIRHYWSGALELVALMLDYVAFTGDEDFARATLLPLADAVVAFYDHHYPRDDAGKILFKPAQSLETWQQAVNPLPPIAGLEFVLGGLLALPAGIADEAQCTVWKRLRSELPTLPVREIEGKRVLAAAREVIGGSSNSENPELYAVFPYRRYGVGKPDLDLARRTFACRRVKGNHGWRQDDTQAALLGLAGQAREYVAGRFATKNPGSRFPAFWGPNFDWIPDQDHGGNGLMALQTMLLQADGRKILVFPAWPKEWDVDFKLHAPFNTTIEGAYRAGGLERLKVSPPEREADIVMLDAQ